MKNTKKKKQTRQEQIAGLPVKEKTYTLDKPFCPKGHELKKIGKKLVGDKLHFQPAKLWVEKIYSTTYKCERCSHDEVQAAFYQAPKPQGLFAHSLASPSVLENIVYQKYVSGTPLYRQLKDWHRLGWQVTESTLADWIIRGTTLLQPLYQVIHDKLLQCPFLQGDETVIQVLHEPGKKPTSESRRWIIRTSQTSHSAGIFYAYKPDRKKSGQELYVGFKGVLQCDGYAVYNSIDCQARVGCLAHVRRKFYEAAKYDKQAQKTLKILNQSFNLEKGWKILSGSERQLKRLDELSPLLDIFWNCLNSLATLSKSLLGKAIVYAHGQKESINKLVKYGELDISNNTCEQAVKSLVVDRKNFLFSTSVVGAKANAIWLTLIESAKANGLDPQKDLTKILTLVPRLGPFPTEKELETYCHGIKLK
ncbi:IS66 family transposase [Ligilactobacillus acidipiscis]|nr:IS66 family transposase [Ligilactobacillus acidipiscis]WEV58107.1 IS66 family transposase [Ligilactobacillus acidipiscis]